MVGVATIGKKVEVLEAEEAANMEEGGIGDVSLHEVPRVGVVA